MITLFHNGNEYPLENTEYYIRELANGLDECIFQLNIHDPIYQMISEEEQIVDRAGQTYKVKQIDGGANDAKIVCQLDIDAWKATLNVNYNSDTKTVYQQINAVKPAGWTVNDRSGSSIGRTLEGDLTPYDVCVECTNVYQVYIRWDNKTKICTIYPKAMGSPVGAFASRELNLKEINYKGKSNDLCTRLYAYGKDGLSFADINDGKPYVENFSYTSQVICQIWRDDRYEVKQNLLADATEKLAQMAKPQRTYECSIVDLKATNPDLYGNMNFDLFTAATLIDDIKETSVDYQVVERHVFPYHPEMNEVIFNSEPLKITASVINIEEQIENPNSVFQQIQQQKIQNATAWLTKGDGYVVAVKNDDGSWKELLFMDTDDMATATNVLRINTNGIGFSTNGVNGPYANAWTIDGNLVADFITTGTLTANLVKAGILEDVNGKFSLNMETGVLVMKDGTFTGTIHATAGDIGTNATAANRWQIGSYDIHNKVTSFTDTTNEGVYIGTDGINFVSKPSAQSPAAYTRISKGGIQAQTNISTEGGVTGASLNTQKAGTINAYNSGGTQTFNVNGSNGNVTASGDITAGGDITADAYKVVKDGQTWTGTSDTIAWTSVSGESHALIVKDGIVVGIS